MMKPFTGLRTSLLKVATNDNTFHKRLKLNAGKTEVMLFGTAASFSTRQSRLFNTCPSSTISECGSTPCGTTFLAPVVEPVSFASDQSASLPFNLSAPLYFPDSTIATVSMQYFQPQRSRLQQVLHAAARLVHNLKQFDQVTSAPKIFTGYRLCSASSANYAPTITTYTFVKLMPICITC